MFPKYTGKLCKVIAPYVSCFKFMPLIQFTWGDSMLVHRIRISNSIDKKLYEKLKELSEETRIPMSKLLDEAIEDLLKKHSAEK